MSSGLQGIYGPNLVMCCLCFGGFTREELYVDMAGDTWDQCRPCVGMEALVHLRKLVEGAEQPVSTGEFMTWLDRSRAMLGMPDRSIRDNTPT